MRSTPNSEELAHALLEVVGYTVTSARTLLDETPAYGPLRLLEAAARTIGVMQAAGISPAAVAELKVRIEASMAALFEDEASFRASVDEIISALLHLD